MTINTDAAAAQGAIAPIEAAVVAGIDIEAVIERLAEAIAIPSFPGSAGEVAIQHFFHRQFQDAGLETDFWPIDVAATRVHPQFPGLEAERGEAWGLVGAYGGDEGPTLVLNGHVDVVPAGDMTQWTTKPFEAVRADGKVYGRGTADMKGGMLCALAAVKAVKDAGVNLKGKVLLQSVIGEEDGGLGTFSTLLRGHGGDAAMIIEPTSLSVVPACAGALTFRLHLHGHSTHAGLRTEGVSVIEKFWLFWKAIEELETRRNLERHPWMEGVGLPYPINIGLLKAGQWPSSVPDELMAEGRYGVALGESIEAARHDLEETIREVNESDPWLREHPATLEWFGGQFAPGAIPEDHPFLDVVAGAHEDLHGAAPSVHGVPWGSDLRLLSGFGGIPALHYGPGDLRVCHAVNEYVPEADLKGAAETLALIILRFCGYEQP